MTDGPTSRMQQVADASVNDPVGFHFRDRQASRPLWTARDGVGASALSSPFQISPAQLVRPQPQPVDGPEVRELVALLLGREAEGRFEALLGDQLAAGCAVEDIFLRLFQPAARHLGVLWAEDICTFVDVTLAMSLLQGGLRRLAPRLRRHGRSAEGSRSIVLSTLTGDQHTFGLMMTAEFFRRSGWAADVLTSGDGDELLARLRFEQNAIVGFSVSHPDHIPKLAAAIRQLRRLGRDRIAGILVGGPLLITHPGCTRDLGADAVGSDAPQAVMAAERLVSAGAGG